MSTLQLNRLRNRPFVSDVEGAFDRLHATTENDVRLQICVKMHWAIPAWSFQWFNLLSRESYNTVNVQLNPSRFAFATVTKLEFYKLLDSEWIEAMAPVKGEAA